MKKFRKVAAIFAASALAVTSLSACNRDSSADGGKSGGEKKKVVLLVSTLSNPFFVQLRDGAQKEADAAGVELQVQDARDDAATQTNQIDNAIATGANLVIINPVDSDAAAPGVKKLNEAKIPVIAVDRGVTGAQLTSFVSSDNVAGGKQAAESLAKAIGENGEVLVLQGVPGSSASRDRGKGFEQGIAAFKGIKVAAKQTAEFDRAKGLDVTNNLLQANPNIKGIFAENDEMALGAIEALGQNPKGIKVVGFDGTKDGLAAIKADRMVATIAQQPEQLGKLAIQQAKKALDGGKVEAEVPVSVVTVTKENVGEVK
ncbi:MULTISPECIES: D-ribose ABC transporter substrate-binding protein [Arcanobacterium]|uniref:D-ribose ABC transporter substrate-binding protein n=1 Tax=Arcanobacterium bovis TaxID=2529275 RepID=A0A4Q9V0P7_9ACTO|nr:MULTISPECIES: D-ribose ABC transporter substrate-binding protein [Arcanobacterium]MBM7824992.1 ribose transport system substrate-binding protein [Arcanobacterium pluranimalium]TBW22208.1 D-ribose ABC transporter substrate-binding protein [Arcanobacterium bovis]